MASASLDSKERFAARGLKLALFPQDMEESVAIHRTQKKRSVFKAPTDFDCAM